MLFVGCAGKPTSYIYPNQTIEVVSIEIVLNQNSENTGINEDNFDILADLNEEDFVLFTKKIQSLKTYRKRGGPLWGYGKYFARITYINGDIEILGYENIEFIKKGASKCVSHLTHPFVCPFSTLCKTPSLFRSARSRGSDPSKPARERRNTPLCP